ncbi:MAG TPA: MCE family protein [Planctomycetes bacterium]|nr:MCE family protein [Planctomycetota bacterium]
MNNKRQFLLGVFFVTALSLLASYTLFFTDTVSLFSTPDLLEVYFPDAYGLREGDPVRVSGMRIGRVKSLELIPNNPPGETIRTVLSLDQNIELLKGFSITINESTLLGGRHVQIEPGPYGGPPRDPNAKIKGTIKRNPIEALGQIGEALSGGDGSLSRIISNLDEIVAGVRDGKGLVGRLLTDERLANDVADSVSSIRNATGKIDRGEGLLGALVANDQLARDLEDALANLRSTTEKIDRGEGLLGALVNDPEIANSVRGAISSIETIAGDLQAGEGLAGRLIYDDRLADSVQEAIDAFASVGRKIDTGTGTIGRLVSDEEMADGLAETLDNFRSASADLQALVATVRSGEGTVGKLLVDEELYDEALTAVKLLTRSLEDYREAAPVTAFTSVLFAAF